MELLSAFGIFDPSQPSSATEVDKEKAAAESQKNLEILASHYGTGDDAPVNAEELRKEWESFSVMLVDHYSKAKTREVLRDLASDKLRPVYVYPQLAHLACISLTIPFSTADCERAFSTMKRVKTPLRNRLKTTTLDWLLRISIEGPDLNDFDFELAVNKWCAIRNRRIM